MEEDPENPERHAESEGDDFESKTNENTEEKNHDSSVVKEAGESDGLGDDDHSNAGDGDSDSDDGDDSDGSGSSSDDDDDDDNDDLNGMSDYERLREERIRRNREYLSQLGLEGKNGEGVLGGRKQTKSRPKKQKSDQAVEPRRQSLGRASKKEVNYNKELDLRLLTVKTKKERKPRSNKVGGGKARIPQIVFNEFRRMKRQRKENTKQLKRYKKQSIREVKYWSRQHHLYQQQKAKQERQERLKQQQEDERKLLGGKTKVELLNELDRRRTDLWAAMYEYDKEHEAEEALKQAEEAKRQEAKRLEQLNVKMEMIDALDRFPKALKEATRELNDLLVSRSPKDPPPPRRSSRGSVDETPLAKPKTPGRRKGRGAADEGPNSTPSWSTQMASIIPSNTDPILEPATPDKSSSIEPEASQTEVEGTPASTKKKREATGRNVGGWISPTFSEEIDRSWLSQEKPLTKGLQNIADYVPQVGHLVLYYPGNHNTFMKIHPDLWGNKSRNLLRTPLWVRARRLANRQNKLEETQSEQKKIPPPAKTSSRGRKRKRKSSIASSPVAESKKEASPPKASEKKEKDNSVPWWTDEWINGIETEAGQYPIVCRVERAYAEFPYDDNLKYRRVNPDGTVTWAIPKAIFNAKAALLGKKKKVKKTSTMRLNLLLRPITPVIPPTWPSLVSEQLDPPPTFTLVTFPSTKAEPFIAPFAWSYCLNHAVEIGNKVEARSTPKSSSNATVSEFFTIDERFGTFRLDDKIAIIKRVLESLTSPDAIRKAVATQASTNVNFPVQDAMAVVNFLSPLCESESVDVLPSTPTRLPTLIELIRATLPLANGIGVRYQSVHRKLEPTSHWHLHLLENGQRAMIAKSIFHGFLQGGPSRLDKTLRLKMNFALQDFLESNPDSILFAPMVTEDIAPSYYCAVPIAMHFERIQSRLKPDKNGDCYYTSADSMIADLQAIMENCILYNSPESPVFVTCSELVPRIKKRMLDVYTKHAKETALRASQDENTHLDLPASHDCLPARRKKGSMILDRLNTPYDGPLERQWMQSFAADSSLDNAFADPLSWVPQAGDKILYSRSRHLEFASTMSPYLSVEQRQVPLFSTNQDATEEVEKDGDSPMKEDSAEISEIENVDLWLHGTIHHVRTTFPRAQPDGVSELDNPLPILVLKVRFPYTWAKRDLFEICWRPSVPTKNGAAFDNLNFLRPAYTRRETIEKSLGATNVLEIEGWSLGSESGLALDPTTASLVCRCFDVLKRRCLSRTDADHVDPKLCLENAQLGTVPIVTSVGSRSLPSFESLLASTMAKQKVSKKVGTRGIRRQVDDRPIEILSAMHYLPVWAVDYIKDDPKKRAFSNYASLLVTPSLSLELVRLRLKEGYYRSWDGAINDLQEAYVTSVLFLLHGPASRRKNRLSVRRIAKFLQSPKGNVWKSHLSRPNQLKKKFQKKSIITESELAKAVKPKPLRSKGEESEDPLNEFSVEERNLITRIIAARKLYSMAVTAIRETRHVGVLFGLPQRKSTPDIANNAVAGTPTTKTINRDSERDNAAKHIRYLLAAIGNDVRRNQFRSYGIMNFKISVDEKIITRTTPPLINEDGSKSPGRVMSHHQFVYNDFEKNDALAQVMFRRPGRRSPCVRCQVYGNTFYSCRVRQCHSNPDFDFIANLKDFGGVDGLLTPFERMQSPEKPKEGAESEVASNVSPGVTPGVEDRHPSYKDEETAMKDPTPYLESAQRAVESSASLYEKSTMLSAYPMRLGPTFIKNVFPVDPADGHYTWCIICGLSGDVLCCDGCSNVVHTHCAGLKEIPEGDWFCEVCCRQSKGTPNSSGALEELELIPDSLSKPTEKSTEPPDGTNGEKVNEDEIEGHGAVEASSDQAQDPSEHVENDDSPPLSMPPTPSITDEELATQVKKLEEVLQYLSEPRQALQAKPKVLRVEDIQVGTAFQKTFEGLGEFQGKVIKMPDDDHSFYEVEYEDGDAEDLEEEELLQLLNKSMVQDEGSPNQGPGQDDSKGRRRRKGDNRGRVPVESPPEPPAEVKRRRGRPQKREKSYIVKTEKPSKKRARGRPRKSIASEVVPIIAASPKRRGRPRKYPTATTPSKEPIELTNNDDDSSTLHGRPARRRSRGRPRQAEASQSLIDSIQSKEDVPTTRKRRGQSMPGRKDTVAGSDTTPRPKRRRRGLQVEDKDEVSNLALDVVERKEEESETKSRPSKRRRKSRRSS